MLTALGLLYTSPLPPVAIKQGILSFGATEDQLAPDACLSLRHIRGKDLIFLTMTSDTHATNLIN
eukprot:54055-Eustigmatos_ZCMA.PRE.1